MSIEMIIRAMTFQKDFLELIFIAQKKSDNYIIVNYISIQFFTSTSQWLRIVSSIKIAIKVYKSQIVMFTIRFETAQ